MCEFAPGVWVGSEEAAQQKENVVGKVKHVLIVGIGTLAAFFMRGLIRLGMKPAFPAVLEYRIHHALDVETEDLVLTPLSQRCAHSARSSLTLMISQRG